MNRIFIRRRARSLVAAALVALGLASATTARATDPIPTPEPSDPTPTVCMSQTVLNSFSATGGPFEDDPDADRPTSAIVVGGRTVAVSD